MINGFNTTMIRLNTMIYYLKVTSCNACGQLYSIIQILNYTNLDVSDSKIHKKKLDT